MNRDGSVSDPSQIAAAIRKMQEDPLFVIKRKEAEHHKSLIENPLIRERVRQMVRAEKERETLKTSYDEGRKFVEPKSRDSREDRQRRARSDSRSRSPNPISRRNIDESRYRHSRDYYRSERGSDRQDERRYPSGDRRTDYRYRRRSRSRSPQDYRRR